MIQESPRQKGIGKTKAGKPKVKQNVYARSRSKRATKGEGEMAPLTYPEHIGYEL
jgi:hypothetical protein